MNILETVIILAVLAILVAVAIRAHFAAHNEKEDHTSRPRRRKGFRRTWRKFGLLPIGIHRLAGWLPGRQMRYQVQFCNIAEGTADRGIKSYIPDVAISRYNIVKQGSDDFHVTPSAAQADIPLGVSMDSSDAANLDLPIAIAVFGAVAGTQRVVLGGTVAAGDFLQSNGDGTALKLKATTGSWYKIGRALMAGVAGDTIEFAPCMPDLIVVP